MHLAVVEPESAVYFVEATARFRDNGITVHALTDVLTNPVRTTSVVLVADFDHSDSNGTSITLAKP